MSMELRGLPAAPGVTVATPWIYPPPAVEASAPVSLAEAAAAAGAELERLAGRLREQGAADEAGILDAQALMAADEELLGAVRDRLDAGDEPVAAILGAGEAVAAVFDGLDDPVLAARAADVRDVAARIARHLAGSPAPALERRSVVLAVDLAPSVTVELDRDLLAGIALEGGSRTSHATILARALRIPAVVGVSGLLESADGATAVGVDGAAGRVVLDPDEAQAAELSRAAEAAAAARIADDEIASRPLVTADGHRVACFANVAEPDDAAPAFAAGAEGIGLFRTEFAFAGRATAPTEEDQATAYETVLRAAADAPVVVRLADIGGDKPLAYLPIAPEANPFLGVRAIRLVDAHPELFPTQVRAILRASSRAGRPASIMAPMVADAADVAWLRRLVDEARAAVPDAPAPRIGIMVELPAAVLLADRLATTVDFMSIGTNDLTQYLLAADRTNSALAERQDPLHPALLRAVERVVAGARGAGGGCEVGVCGEMAGDPVGAAVLVGLGVDELSMEPAAMGPVKRFIGTATRGELQRLARQALDADTADEVRVLVGDR